MHDKSAEVANEIADRRKQVGADTGPQRKSALDALRNAVAGEDLEVLRAVIRDAYPNDPIPDATIRERALGLLVGVAACYHDLREGAELARRWNPMIAAFEIRQKVAWALKRKNMSKWKPKKKGQR